MADDEDPYVVYQLRKPHQRGTAVVPRLVPKSHAPAFSAANYKFTRVRAPTDDCALYLPKSLEYPTKWDSFGSASSAWSGSSAASRFPARLAALGSPLNSPPPRSRETDARDADTESVTSSTGGPAASARTSILSSEGTRSLKNFRFGAPFHADGIGGPLHAPVPIRPVVARRATDYEDPLLFVLPAALSQVAREDSIVEHVRQHPATTLSEDSLTEEFVADTAAFVRRQRADAPVPRPRPSTVNGRQQADAGVAVTRTRRTMWGWLFGGGDAAPVRRRGQTRARRERFEDVQAAPLMDDEEEARRRAQFVQGSKSSGNVFGSWRRSRSVDRRGEAPGPGNANGGSARRIWSKIKRSASFTFGSKKKLDVEEEDEEEVIAAGGRASLERPVGGVLKRSDSTEFEQPDENFIRRKIDSLRASSSRRMASAAGEVQHFPSGHTASGGARRRDPVVPPQKRREDRPRPVRTPQGAVGMASTPATLVARRAAGRPRAPSPLPRQPVSSLDQMFLARPELQGATTESVETLASRINSDLSYGTSVSGSGRMGSNSMEEFASAYGRRDPMQGSSAVSSPPSSYQLNETRAYGSGLNAIVCEEAQSPISQWRPPSAGSTGRAGSARSDSTGSGSRKSESVKTDSGPLDQHLSSASKMSLELMKARVAAAKESKMATRHTSMSPVSGGPDALSGQLGLRKTTSGSSTTTTLSAQLELNAEVRGMTGSKSGDFSDPHPTELDVYCQCSCSCVYEEDCEQACESRAGKTAATTTTTTRSVLEAAAAIDREQQRHARLLQVRGGEGAKSPSVGVINGSREPKTRARITEADWEQSMRQRFPLAGATTIATEDPPLHTADEFVGRNPRGFHFDQPRPASDWAARYGASRRPEVRTDVPAFHRHAGNGPPLREEYPTVGGVPVQLQRGPPPAQRERTPAKRAPRGRDAPPPPTVKSPLSRALEKGPVPPKEILLQRERPVSTHMSSDSSQADVDWAPGARAGYPRVEREAERRAERRAVRVTQRPRARQSVELRRPAGGAGRPRTAERVPLKAAFGEDEAEVRRNARGIMGLFARK